MSKNKEGIFLTSRIRLARNISGIPFPEWSSVEDQNQVKLIAKKAITKLPVPFTYKELAKTKGAEVNLLVEQNVLSSHFAKGDASTKAFAVNQSGVSIMINEEDHLRLSIQKENLNLEECLGLIDKVDTDLSSQIEFAFSKELGFATACPSNVGTGMRASIMLHLPALCLQGKIGPLIRTLSESHITVRGLFGEGSMALGHIFQISNLNTLGISEKETINYLEKVALSVHKKEALCRKNISKTEELFLKDKVNRAIGILKYACLLSYEEALDHLSIISLGQRLGLEKKLKPLKNLAELSKQLRDGHIAQKTSKTFRDKAIDKLRAEKVRQLVS